MLYLGQMIIPDEATAIKVVSLPFLDTIEWSDQDAMQFMAGLSQSDPVDFVEFLTHDSAQSGDSKPIPLIYLELNNPAAASEIAAQAWVMDGLHEFEYGTVRLLVQAAIASNRLFRHLMDSELAWIPLQTGADNATLERLVDWSKSDENTVIRLVSMPFMETIEFGDLETVRRLQELAQNNPESLQKVLSHPTLADGITDQLVIQVSLLYLEQTNPEISTAISGLPWVQDGITYVPPGNWSSGKADPEEFESHNVRNMVELGVRSPEFLLQLTAKPWVIDGISNKERGVLSPFNNLTGNTPQLAIELLNMPFLTTVDGRDINTLWKLAHLTRNSGVPLKEFLSSPELARGITDNNQAIVDLLEVKAREPEEYDAIQALPWIQDGLGTSEGYAVWALTELALETDAVFMAIMEKRWVWDGITQGEAQTISRLTSMSGQSLSQRDVDTTLRIVAMPFLDTFDPLDTAAVNGLALLGSEGDGSYLRQVLDHPSLSEGIMDRDILIISVLHRVVRRSPETVNILLDPNQVYREERTIQLPLGGETDLAVIRIAPGTFRTIDILEEIVRQQEEFTKVAFPTGLVAIVNIEISTGGGPSGIITLRTGNEENFELIAHEAAHTYWSFYPPWIREGAAELMAKIVIGELDQAPASPNDTGCSLADTIGELDQLTYGPDADGDAVWWSGCMYTMGLGLYADLYNSLGDEEFRRGFGGLYLKMRLEEHNDECFGVERGLCYVRKAFVEGASPGFADTAGGVIDRWYYGASQ